jgi:hypothetical protein
MVDVIKPLDKEDEYFAREEIERKKRWAKERAEAMAVEEKQKLKDLHYMKCPKCGMDLGTIEYKGIKVDTCGACHGTWFDAGELDQVLAQEQGFFGKMRSIFK